MAYTVKNLKEKFARYRNHLTFLMKCRDKHVIPKGLRVRISFHSRRSGLIAHKVSQTLLRERIQHVRRTKVRTAEELEGANVRLKVTMNREKYQQVSIWSDEAAEKVFQNTKKTQQDKLRRLLASKKTSHHKPEPTLQTNTVVNRSNRTLDKDEKEILSLGLNFALPPQKLLIDDIISSTEWTARQLDHQSGQQLHQQVKGALEQYKPPTRSNISRTQQQDITRLKQDGSIVILRADKGNSTVVMNREEYEEKIDNILGDGSYRCLKKDPTAKLERTIDANLKRLVEIGEMDDILRKRLPPQQNQHPQLYGLPKIHKLEVPLCPIVSSVGSTTYHLAQKLARILTPLRGKSKSYIKNSPHFVEKIKELKLEDSELLVSFDVKRLFTKVPIQEAILVVEQKLLEDELLEERTVMIPSTICHLIQLCMTSTYYAYREHLYEQTEGAPMGSPLSPVLADMEFFETMDIEKADQKPTLWCRYVDDMFVVWLHGRSSLESFLQHLNAQRPSIQFTMETETDGTLPFLDVLVHRERQKLTTTVYRKPTHTDLYLNFKSNHHPRVKTSTIKCLAHRAQTVSHPNNLQTELEHLQKVFVSNKYPPDLVRRCLKKKGKKSTPDTTCESYILEERPKLLCLPYVKGLSERIERACKNVTTNLKVVFKSQ